MTARKTMPNSGFAGSDIWRTLHRDEPVLLYATVILAAMMFPAFLAYLAETRTFNGINVWIKPLKFMSSAAIFLATLAIFMPYLDQADRARKSVNAAVWIISVFLILEILYITFRASRAEASHFNRENVIGIVLYAWMGITILISTALAGWIGWLILMGRDKIAAPELRYAIGVGLMLGTALGSLTAIYMSTQTGHWVGGVRNDSGGSFFFGWSRTGGDLRVAHFIGLHAMQGIPLIGWFASFISAAAVKPAVIVSAALWVLVTAATFGQAIAARALLPL
ncbi:MAG: hypothetical protein KF807_10510 [Xanthobacteraceae bacterium]|nr:hypothetical protein [Xanthobacteraceae bacterium]